jgi:hypothetical protein
MGIDRNSVSYSFIDDGRGPKAASVETVTGVVTEYGVIRKGGDHVVWNTEPAVEAAYPLAKRIANEVRNGGEVYRRRVIVVDDWVEVDAEVDAEVTE